jgi:hypothetical protein
MTEAIDDCAMANAGGDQVCRMGVPQIMKSHARQPEACKTRQTIPTPHVGRVERRPCGRAEDELAVAEFRAQMQEPFLLTSGRVPDRRYGLPGASAPRNGCARSWKGRGQADH